MLPTLEGRSIPDDPTSPQTVWSTLALSRLTPTDGVSARDAADVRTHTIQALDAELSALQFATRLFRARRNALFLTSLLPAEVLLHIFGFTSAMDSFEKGRHRLGWLAITHVCRRWRNVALESPCLWRDNIGNELGNEWLELVLTRTREIPITLSCSMNYRNSKTQLNMVAKHFHHIRALTLQAPAAALSPFLSSQSFSDGMLEVLDLDGTGDFTNFVAPELPATMIGARLPALREVNLTGLSIPWSAPILCTLTQLKINLSRTLNLSIATSELYKNSSYDDVLSALEKMTNLELLHLEHCLPVNSGPATVNVALPHLVDFSLEDTLKACFEIFRQVTIPSACRLCLCCDSTSVEDITPSEDISQVLPALEKHFGTENSCPPFKHLLLFHPINETHQVEAWRARPSDPHFPSRKPDLDIILPASADPQASLRAVCGVLPLHAVEEILVAPGDAQTPCLSPASWRTVLGRCPKPMLVKLKGNDVPTLSTALMPSLDAQGRATRPVGTGIGRILIEDADFTASSEIDGVPCSHGDMFTRWLHAWRGSGLSLPVLAIHDCFFGPGWPREVRDICAVELLDCMERKRDDGDQGGGEGQDSEDENQGDEDQDDEGAGGDLQDDFTDNEDQDNEGIDSNLEDDLTDSDFQNLLL